MATTSLKSHTWGERRQGPATDRCQTKIFLARTLVGWPAACPFNFSFGAGGYRPTMRHGSQPALV